MLSTKLLAAFVALLASSDAFTITSSSGRETTALHASRRAFLDATLVVTAAVVGAQPAFADSDTDLSMPAEEEQRAADEAAMAERLRRKAELQKKASKPATVKESMEAEIQKKQDLKMSKIEKRNALCEELGRGC